MASSRFPGKPMAEILGMPMIGHVYYRSKMSHLLNDLYVATCDQEIGDYISSLGGKVVLTVDSHERASDRIGEATLKIESKLKDKIDIVVMIQGDEPMVVPDMIDQAIEPLLSDPNVNIVNLFSELKSEIEHRDPNEVKVVIDRNSFAIYFSREPIPSRKMKVKNIPMYKQVCIIPFKRDFLLEYIQMQPTILEIVESIDMNRILEHGMRVKMIKTDLNTYSVDTVNDLKKVENLMCNDSLISYYVKQSHSKEVQL